MNNRIILIIGVTLLLIAGITGYFVGKSDSRQTSATDIATVSESFIVSLTKGDIDSTYGKISTSFQARNGKGYIEDVAKSVKTDSPNITEQEVFVGSGLTKNDAIYLATVTNLPKQDDSTSGSFIIRLVNEEGKWKVDSAQIY